MISWTRRSRVFWCKRAAFQEGKVEAGSKPKRSENVEVDQVFRTFRNRRQQHSLPTVLVTVYAVRTKTTFKNVQHLMGFVPAQDSMYNNETAVRRQTSMVVVIF